ncbi:IclR family transcriptional regulator domain-containing protein [Paracidovorax cattleyae]|uniref:IclR family transcriptional regulator domain-containing protein n=1 Tax=Paracidovorax cattleyae TaxID=80868 RepID=UPI003EBE5C8C
MRPLLERHPPVAGRRGADRAQVLGDGRSAPGDAAVGRGPLPFRGPGLAIDGDHLAQRRLGVEHAIDDDRGALVGAGGEAAFDAVQPGAAQAAHRLPVDPGQLRIVLVAGIASDLGEVLVTGRAALPSGPRPRSSVSVAGPAARSRCRLSAQDHGPDAPRTIEDTMKFLKQARQRGYSMISDMFPPGMSAMAAPIRDASGVAIGVVTVAGPLVRLTPERMEQVSPHLLQTAELVASASSALQLFRKAA